MAISNQLPTDVVAELDRMDAKDARERARKGQKPYNVDAMVVRMMIMMMVMVKMMMTPMMMMV
eukprot:5557505-Pyramimonas_sp.AAC.1